MPWHQTHPQAQDYQWFKNLVELHEMTHSWRQAIQIERPEYFMTRGIESSATENLWMLDSLSEKKLEDFLAEQPLQDVLSKLEHAVWTVQAWTLEHFIPNPNKAPDPDQITDTVMMSNLEQLCWKAGRSSVEKRWSLRLPKESTSQTSRPQFSLSQTILAFEDSPLSGYPHRKTHLIRRAVQHQIELELLHCPHQSRYPEIKAAADALCHLHWHFLKGFAYTLDHRIRSTYTRGDSSHLARSLTKQRTNPLCCHTWKIAHPEKDQAQTDLSENRR